jgi:hypothetical protein
MFPPVSARWWACCYGTSSTGCPSQEGGRDLGTDPGTVDDDCTSRILKEGKKYDDLSEVAKLFNIHATE